MTEKIELSNEKLDEILNEIEEKLEQGRNDIFQIAHDCQKNIHSIRARLEEIIISTAIMIQKVDDCEKKEKLAREKLLVVSSDFTKFSENDIKFCYEAAQQCQIELLELRQMELQLRSQRDDLLHQLRYMESISLKADEFLQNSSMALHVLQGNIKRFSGLAEQAKQKEQMGLWLIESMELERRKIARELHDGPAQTLASILIRVDILSYLCKEDLVKLEEVTKGIREMGQECLDDIRRMMFDLKPSTMQNLGLIKALDKYFRGYAAKYDFSIDFSYTGTVKNLPFSLDVALFRMIQEAITNVRKHAGVKKAQVKIQFKPTRLLATIEDEGKGFQMEQYEQEKTESYGIINLKERAELLGGFIKIISEAGVGTKVMIEVPIQGEEQHGK